MNMTHNIHVKLPENSSVRFFEKCIKASLLLFVLWISSATLSLGQTPGLIIKSAVSPGLAVLDPDGDGYVSQKTNGLQLGFTIPPNNDVTQSEIPYVPLVRPDPTGDLMAGPSCSFTEIVVAVSEYED